VLPILPESEKKKIAKKVKKSDFFLDKVFLEITIDPESER